MDLKKALKNRKLPFNIMELPEEIPECFGISYSSLSTNEGDLFFAVKGYAADGHKFIKDAKEKKAAAVICEKKDTDTDIPQIVVSDSRRALSYLSALFYDFPSNKLHITGVTGTNGKSTTCSIIEKILEKTGKRVGVIGTIDRHYKLNNGKLKSFESSTTTPESKDLHELLHNMKKDGVNHVVMEVSSHSIFLSRVSDISFNTLILTNITQDHLDFHKSMEEYTKVKSDFIISRTIGFENFPNVTAVINTDDTSGKKLAEKLKSEKKESVITYSLDKEADLMAKEYKTFLNLTKGKIEYKNKTYDFSSPLTGEFNIQNILAASGGVLASGTDAQACFNFICESKNVPGRLEQVVNTKRPNIFVDYAHTPDALENVLKALRPLCRKRLICVFGCGGDRDNAKRPLMGEISGKYADISIVTSDNPRTENPEKIISHVEDGIRKNMAKKDISQINKTDSGYYLIQKDRKQAIRTGIKISDPEDCILIAGKGHETYQIIGREKLSFDDRKTAFQEVVNIYGK